MNNSNNRPHRCSCGKSFKSVADMDQHRRDAPIHLVSFASVAQNMSPPPHPSTTTTSTMTETTGTGTGTGTGTAASATAAVVGGGVSITSGVTSTKKKKKVEGRRDQKGRGRLESSPYTYSSYSTYSSPQYKLNPLTSEYMDMWQDQNYGACDKDCGWCGHCLEHCQVD